MCLEDTAVIRITSSTTACRWAPAAWCPARAAPASCTACPPPPRPGPGPPPPRCPRAAAATRAAARSRCRRTTTRGRTRCRWCAAPAAPPPASAWTTCTGRRGRGPARRCVRSTDFSAALPEPRHVPRGFFLLFFLFYSILFFPIFDFFSALRVLCILNSLI